MLRADYIDKIRQILGDDTDKLVEATYTTPVRGLTINTQKITIDKLISAMPYITPIEGTEQSYYLNSDMKVGAEPLHHGGAYYMQDPSAIYPVLAVGEGDYPRILDLCAAPGGKSVQLALKYPNAKILSNEIVRDRAKILYSNIERMGFGNVAVSNNSPQELASIYGEYFDMVVVDAPCSGEGMFRKEPQSIDEWSYDKVLGCAKRQRDILDSADRLLKIGGTMVYSTCTFSPEENEEQVKYLIDKGYTPMMPTDSTIAQSSEGLAGYGVEQVYMRRRYYHLHEGEGQFFAVLKKTSGGESTPRLKANTLDKRYIPAIKELLGDKVDISTLSSFGEGHIYIPVDTYPEGLRLVSGGVQVATYTNGRCVPEHNLFTAKSDIFPHFEVEYNDAKKYLRGEELYGDIAKGYGVVTYLGVPLGGYKCSNGALKNYYPKALRLMER